MFASAPAQSAPRAPAATLGSSVRQARPRIMSCLEWCNQWTASLAHISSLHTPTPSCSIDQLLPFSSAGSFNNESEMLIFLRNTPRLSFSSTCSAHLALQRSAEIVPSARPEAMHGGRMALDQPVLAGAPSGLARSKSAALVGCAAVATSAISRAKSAGRQDARRGAVSTHATSPPIVALVQSVHLIHLHRHCVQMSSIAIPLRRPEAGM